MLPISYSVRNLGARKATTALTAGGVAGVVFVLAAALMLQSGIRETLGRTGSDKNAIVLRKGSASEMASMISLAALGTIRAAPGIAHASDGSPLVLGELVLIKYLDAAHGGGGGNVQIRGVPAGVFDFRREVRVVEGRALRPGSDEAMIGRGLRGRFENLELGRSFELRKGHQVRVVGVFDAGGSAIESELWADLDTARAAFGREGIVSTVRVQLDQPNSLASFSAALEHDRRLGVEVLREDRFFEKQSEGTAIFVGTMGILIALFASAGAMIGAASTMYAAISQRRRETGVLRALGFSRRSILVSFLIESFLVALAGGVLGALCSLCMLFVKFSMMNVTSFSQIVFRFHPTAPILAISALAGALMGLLGGLLPAIRAARISPIEAMRA
jgi:putative ABC transport system permease protein